MIIIAYIALNKGLNKILLDDDSDLAHKGSIYQKLNCQYINEPPEPEMECFPQKVLDKYDEFKNKYLNKGFFINKL